VDGGEVLLSLAPVPAGAGRERLRDRFRLPFHLTSWGVEAVTGVRTELFCIATVRPGTLVLRGRGLVVLETPSVRLVRAIPFCRLVAVALNAHLEWRARAVVEGVEVRVGPGGAVEGWLHVAVDCRGEPRPVSSLPTADPGGATSGVAGWRGPIAAATWRPGSDIPAAVRKVGAAVKRLEATVATDGLALVSGAVELDVAWADRSGRGRWTCREVPFSALLSIAGLCEGDRLEPVAQVERQTRVGKGVDERVFLLVGVGLTALRTVHLELGGAWYRAERVVGQAAVTVELNEPLFPREGPSPAERRSRSHVLELETGLPVPWVSLRARIRHTGSRAALEVRAEPYGHDRGTAEQRGGLRGDRSAPDGVRLDLPGTPGALTSLAAVGARAVVRVGRPSQDGGMEVGLTCGTAAATWHRLPGPVRWIADAAPFPGGVACLVRVDGQLRRVTLPCEKSVLPAAVTVAGTAVPGAGLDRVWVETVNG